MLALVSIIAMPFGEDLMAWVIWISPLLSVVFTIHAFKWARRDIKKHGASVDVLVTVLAVTGMLMSQIWKVEDEN